VPPSSTRPSGRPGLPDGAERLLTQLHVDLPSDRRRPSKVGFAVATVVSIVGSLLADALLVSVATVLFPSTKGYVHFQFSDYGKLTVLGVVVACVAWPIVTRISSSPRWVFVRMAVLVTIVLLLPDVWILLQGQPAESVSVLMVMHLAIAVVTYNALVWIAPPRPA
jgi:Family of unknown function (DUF6069)